MKKKWIACFAAALVCVNSSAIAVSAKEVDKNYNILALGDSITAGVGVNDYSESYVSILSEYLENPIDNRAESGMKSGELLSMVQSDSSVRDSIQNAEVILVSIGANDIMSPILETEIVQETDADGNPTKVFKVLNFNNPEEMLNSLDAKTRVKFQREITKAMPVAVATANENITAIAEEIKSLNSDADLIFQTVYDPLSITNDTTTLSENAISKINIMSSSMVYQYLNGSGENGTLIPIGLNSNIKDNENIQTVDIYENLLCNAWYYTNLKDMDVHPNAIGHMVIAASIVNSGCVPKGNGEAFAKAYANSGASETLATQNANTNAIVQGLISAPPAVYTLGDVDMNGDISVDDASSVLTQYANHAAGNGNVFNVLARRACDVDENGEISVDDASIILEFYAKHAAGLIDSFDEFLSSK